MGAPRSYAAPGEHRCSCGLRRVAGFLERHRSRRDARIHGPGATEASALRPTAAPSTSRRAAAPGRRLRPASQRIPRPRDAPRRRSRRSPPRLRIPGHRRAARARRRRRDARGSRCHRRDETRAAAGVRARDRFVRRAVGSHCVRRHVLRERRRVRDRGPQRHLSFLHRAAAAERLPGRLLPAEPPCTATATAVRGALDAAGNAIFPMSWAGVLAQNVDAPVPRLMRTRLASPLPFKIPDQVFLGSFTPEGGLLPPILEPQLDPTVLTPDVATMFGSVDAPYTMIRVARRHGTCVGGDVAGARCATDVDCKGGTCQTSCVEAPATLCTTDGDCPSGTCGRLFDLSALTAGGAAMVLPRARRASANSRRTRPAAVRATAPRRATPASPTPWRPSRSCPSTAWRRATPPAPSPSPRRSTASTATATAIPTTRS